MEYIPGGRLLRVYCPDESVSSAWVPCKAGDVATIVTPARGAPEESSMTRPWIEPDNVWARAGPVTAHSREATRVILVRFDIVFSSPYIAPVTKEYVKAAGRVDP